MQCSVKQADTVVVVLLALHVVVDEDVVGVGYDEEDDIVGWSVGDVYLQLAAVGILVAVLNILLQRSGREEQALMTTITALVVVLMIVVQKISELFTMIKSLFGL